ncbi:nucleotidyltransferase family protein [Bacteroidota bacterium]
MKVKNNPETNILCLALSSENVEDREKKIEEYWPQIDEDTLFQSAKTDEVASHITFLLKQTQLEYCSFWIEEYNDVEQRITVLMEALEEVAEKLKQQNITIVALKNAGIAKGIYQNHACSPMGDIDLLVSSKDFHNAHKIILNELGFTFKFRSELEEENIEEAFRGGGTEYFKEIAGYKVWLELQWRPIAGRWIQPHNEPDGDELLARSLPIKDSAVRILAPEDNLLQVALHTAKHSYVRAPGFRLHSDVDRIVRYQEINWELFVKKVNELKVKTAVYFSLYFARELLKTPITDRVLQQLNPQWLRKRVILYYVHKAGIFNQKEKKFSKVGYILFNLALYDSISEIMKAVFPPFETLKLKYNIHSKWQMPYYHFIRLKDLVLKRTKL